MIRTLAALLVSLALLSPAGAQVANPDAAVPGAGSPAADTGPSDAAEAERADDATAASPDLSRSASERAGSRAEIGAAAAPGTDAQVDIPNVPDLGETSAELTTPAGGTVPEGGAAFEAVADGEPAASEAETESALESAPGTSLGSTASEPQASGATPSLSAEPQAGALSGSASSDQAARVMARQRGEVVDDGPVTRADLDSAGAIAGNLASGISDSDVYRSIRYGTEDVVTSTRLPESRVLIQTGGMRWLEVRRGPLLTYGGGLLVAVVALLAMFFLVRGRIRIAGGRSAATIMRFRFLERAAHWLLATSFVLLALSGLVVLFGRQGLIPLVGHEVYAVLATGSKLVHNNVSWAFMVALVIVFVAWVAHNIPSRLDLVWLRKGGGLFSKDTHVPAKKFNAGQKIVFWATIILGTSVSLSGLSLLFPYDLPLFAKTFAALQSTGLPGALGLDLPGALAPQEEMQLSQLWHSVVGFLMMAVVLAHIYIGSIGMQGAFAAMGSGKVDYNWAREHHDLWVAEKERRAGAPSGAGAVPAE